MSLQKIDQDLDNLVSDSKIPIRLSYIGNNGMPGVISLWYQSIEGKIYCAAQNSAKIVSLLQKNPQCGFEIAADKIPYKGVRGYGHAGIIPELGSEILDILISKYLGERESTLSAFLKKNSKKEVAIQITPHSIQNYDYTARMKDV